MAYGIQFRRADGSVVLEQDETFAGIIHVQRLAQDFTGTFSVPKFDADYDAATGLFTGKGMFTTTFECLTTTNNGSLFARAESAIRPELSWNNQTKVMQVTAPAPPSGWTDPSPYRIIFIHYR